MSGFNRTDPFIAFGGKIDPLTDIKNAGIVTNGDVYWVSSEADARHTTRTDSLGRGVVKTSIQAGIDATRNDQNDYVLVVPQDANAVWSQGTALDLNKDRVHLISIGYSRAKQSYSNTIKSTQGTVPDTELFAVTGDGCEVAGIRFLGTLGTNAGGTMSNGVAYIAGLDFWAHDSVFEDSTGAWGTPPVVRGGGTAAHDARFDNCMFAITGTGNVESAGNSALVISGDGNKRWTFNDSVFTFPAGSVTETLFTGGTGSTQYTVFNRCHFGETNGTAFAITSAIRGSVTANNPILLYYCSALGYTAFGTDPNVLSVPNQSGTAAAGVHNPMLYLRGSAAVVAA